MKAKKYEIFFILWFAVFFTAACGGGGDDNSVDGENSLDGVWKFKLTYECDGTIWDAEAENFEAYVKITNSFSYTYICSDGVCYYCTTNDWEEDITNEDYALDGDNMTHSYYEDDDDDNATPECLVIDVFERANETDIDGAVEDCIIYGDLE